MHTKRLQHLQKAVKTEQLDALLIENPTDLFYLTGETISMGSLLFTEESVTLFVDARYYEGCSKRAPCSVELAKQGKLKEWLTNLPLKRMGVDSRHTSMERARQLEEMIAELVPWASPLEKQRLIKNPAEIKAIEAAAQIASQGLEAVLPLLTAGITEAKVAGALKTSWLQRGAEEWSFEPIVAFGANSANPHYVPGEASLNSGDPILIDIGAKCSAYCSDMTRLFFLDQPSKEMVHIYETVYDALQSALHCCRPGCTIAELDSAARDVIQKAGYGELFTHSLGHGVGLEVHEAPPLSARSPYGEVKLEAGMVITLEPGVYQPGLGGVRLEELVVVEERGARVITHFSIPLEREPTIL